MQPNLARTKQYPAELRRPYPRETPNPKGANLPERFVSKVTVDPATGCWVWTGARGLAGHGRLGNDGGRKAVPLVVLAHRYAYERLIGPIEEGMELDHLCRNPPCANPWHVEPVPHAVNIGRGLQGNSDGLCRRGLHAWRGENVISEPNGTLRCRACRDAKERARTERRRQATGRIAHALRTHCPQGHPYAGDNLHVRPNGSRHCRACHRERELRRYHAARGRP